MPNPGNQADVLPSRSSEIVFSSNGKHGDCSGDWLDLSLVEHVPPAIMAI